MKKLLISVLFLIMAFCLFSCMEKDGGGLNSAEIGLAGGAPESSSSPDDTQSQQTKRPAGLITAATHNDNDYYADWQKLFFQTGEGEEIKNGKFFGYSGENSWGLNSLKRVKVTLKNGDTPLPGVKIKATGEVDNSVFTAVTDANGVAYLFIGSESGRVSATVGEATVSGEFTKEERDIELSLNASSEKKNVIDIMFVIDVTGSMGDELEYLKNEISDVINRVCQSNEGVTVNLALLFYRDSGDKEQFAYHDFVNVSESSGLADMQQKLAAQRAEGGGDYPESVDEALEMAMSKQWSSGATTKLIFHLLDAPPHSKDSDRARYNASVTKAASMGIRICPILCSGADDLTEYLTRQAAIYTGGSFIFVTDDSGIGNPHHDPDLPNATVEALNSLLVRLINGYHTGSFAPAVSWREEAN